MMLNLGRGYPHPDALPAAEWTAATGAALRAYGPTALTYGNAAGPAPLIEWLCDRLGRTDAVAPRPAEVFVTAGASHALELLCTQLVRPGDTVLVQAPTYHLALRILADHAAALVPAPDSVPELSALLLRLRAEGRRVPLLYLVPTYGNPTGESLPDVARRALVELAGRTGLVLVEDDTYRELCYEGDPPPSLYALAGGAGVVRVGSFAKSVAPGLRLGFLTGTAGLVEDLARRGYVDSGGGVNHATASIMAEFAGSGAYERHLTEIRHRYRRQRDALVTALRTDLPEVGCRVPDGGWFVWLALPPGADATAALPAARRAGVSYVDGRQFYVDSDPAARGRARLAFSMLDAAELTEGVRRLASVFGPPGRTPAAEQTGHTG